MPSAVIEGLACKYCDREPFKSKAALGSHTSAKHGKTLDGRKAPQRKRRATHDDTSYQAVLQLGTHAVTVQLEEKEVRNLLGSHPEEVLDSMLVA